MFSFGLFAIALFIFPAFICYFLFLIYFPRHIMEVGPLRFIVFSVGAISILTCPILYFPIKAFFIEGYINNSPLPFALGGYVFSNQLEFFMYLALFMLIPPLFFWGVLKFLFSNYQNSIKGEEHIQTLVKIVKKIILSDIGNSLIFDNKKEQLIVDIRLDSNIRFSGIYIDYSNENGGLLTISNALKTENGIKSIMPIKGNMLFKFENIQDLHFWKIKETFNPKVSFFKNDTDQNLNNLRTLIWYHSLKFRIPWVQINPTFSVLPEHGKKSVKTTSDDQTSTEKNRTPESPAILTEDLTLKAFRDMEKNYYPLKLIEEISSSLFA